MIVHRIVNSFHSSNTYILELSKSKVLLIDVGNFDKIYNWLIENKKQVYAVILTHEHSDHCHGLNDLSKKFQFKLYCSHMCAVNIANSKQNLSQYIDDLKTFEINLPEIINIKDLSSKRIYDNSFTFIETPGHSPGSVCIITEDKIYTGDTILNGIKTPLNLPHSNKDQYVKSIQKLRLKLKVGMTIMPGHDIPFKIQSFDNLIIKE